MASFEARGFEELLTQLDKLGRFDEAAPKMMKAGMEILQEEVVAEALDNCLSKNSADWGKIKMVVKDSLGEYLWKKMKRNPMILPIIMEVE